MSLAPIRGTMESFEEAGPEDIHVSTTETTPLLAHAPSPGLTAHSVKTWRHTIRQLWTPLSPFNQASAQDPSIKSRVRSRLALLALIPVIHFAGALPLTTSLDIIRSLACLLWYTINDPDNVPDIKGDMGNDERCGAPGVNEWFSFAILVTSIVMAVGGFFSSTLIGSLSPRLGRKPLQLAFILTAAFCRLLLPLSFKVSLWLFPVWILFDNLAGLSIIILLIYMTVTDLAEEGTRTTYLLFATGLGALGRAPSFFIGGLITSVTGSPFTVYYVSFGLLVCVTILFALLVDESFGPERRAERRRELELQCAQRAENSTSSSAQSGKVKQAVLRAWTSLTAPFNLLARLLPTRNSRTGKKNYRLLILSISFFCGSFVTHYVQGTIVYATTKFHFSAKENGVMLSVVTGTQVIWLLVLSPALLHSMELWYKPKSYIPDDTIPGAESQVESNSQDSSVLHMIAEHNPNDQPADVRDPASSDPASPSKAVKDEEFWRADMIARRDVHVVFISYLLEALSEFCIGLARDGTQMILASVVLGCVGSSGPAMRSAAVASVPALQSGEILATFELVASLASLLAPLQGVLLTILINTAPEIVFFLAGSISLIAALLVLLARARDRYQ